MVFRISLLLVVALAVVAGLAPGPFGAMTHAALAAVIAYAGSAPTGCDTGARSSLPFDGRYGGFEDAGELPDEVLLCGSYEVHETDAGWLAWFTASEAGQTPAP